MCSVVFVRPIQFLFKRDKVRLFSHNMIYIFYVIGQQKANNFDRMKSVGSASWLYIE